MFYQFLFSTFTLSVFIKICVYHIKLCSKYEYEAGAFSIIQKAQTTRSSEVEYNTIKSTHTDKIEAKNSAKLTTQQM